VMKILVIRTSVRAWDQDLTREEEIANLADLFELMEREEVGEVIIGKAHYKTGEPFIGLYDDYRE